MTVESYLAVGFSKPQAELLATLDAILEEMRRGFRGLDSRLDEINVRLGSVETHLRESPSRN